MDNDFGIKISIPGISVDDAGDYQYLFNSAWPSLPIAFSQTTVADFGGTLKHDLGFPPLTMAWLISSDVSSGRYFPDVDKDTIYFNNGVTSGPQTYFVICYNLDISKDAEYKLITPPATSTVYSPDFGIKFSKEGKPADSNDLRDFVLHSRAQSPAVLSVATQKKAQGDTVTYTNPGGYTAWVFGYGGSNNIYTYAPLFSQSVPALRISGDVFSLQFTSNGLASIIALRDPLFAATNNKVTYG